MHCHNASACAIALIACARIAAADPAPAAAPDDPALSRALARRLAALGDYHYRAGHYYNAIAAYEELALFAAPDDTALRVAAGVRIAMSYHHGHQLVDAVGAYEATLAVVRDPDVAAALRIQRAIARAERTFDEPGAEALDAIAAELQPIALPSAPPARRTRALYELARIVALAGDHERAVAAAAELARACVVPAPTCDLQPALARALARPSSPRRSPWLGVVMSAIVPGAGSVYGGHAVDGLYYFALTTLGGLGAGDVYEPGRSVGNQKVAFYGLSALAALFYSGGLLSAYIDVARHDEVDALADRRALWSATDAPLPLEDVAPAP